MEKILTLSKKGTSRLVEKKSVFIGQAAPVEHEQAAVDFINEVRQSMSDARHHTFAYQIGSNNEIQRAHDGGEPSGTAGRPMLEIIKQENLQDTVVVVTRYFGGTLLGTGGLIRAYSKAAHEALLDGVIMAKVDGQKVTFTMDYHLWGKVQNFLERENIFVENIDYLEQVKLTCILVFDGMDTVIKKIRDLCHGTVEVTLGERNYFAGI
ncbi:MAG: IMPACT family protein [Dehalobacterium sp.]|jgi:uncharacterized YigZ family protein